MILRDFKQEDSEPLVIFLNNENVTRYLTTRIPNPYTEQDALLWITEHSKVGINKAIEYNGVLVGAIGVRPGEFDYKRMAEIGYWIAEEYWNKGIATAALKEMTSQIFSTTDIVRLVAPIFNGNKGSKRVLEKCGYQLEGIFKNAIYKNDCFYDEAIYAKLL